MSGLIPKLPKWFEELKLWTKELQLGAIALSIGLFVALYELDNDIIKLNITKAFGVDFYVMLLGWVSIVGVGASVFGGVKLFKLFLQLKDFIKVKSDNEGV